MRVRCRHALSLRTLLVRGSKSHSRLHATAHHIHMRLYAPGCARLGQRLVGVGQRLSVEWAGTRMLTVRIHVVKCGACVLILRLEDFIVCVGLHL